MLLASSFHPIHNNKTKNKKQNIDSYGNFCYKSGYDEGYAKGEDVKEFIRLLKKETEWTNTKGCRLGMITEEQIDKLAGDKLK